MTNYSSMQAQVIDFQAYRASRTNSGMRTSIQPVVDIDAWYHSAAVSEQEKQQKPKN
jgi:hypothetical protein